MKTKRISSLFSRIMLGLFILLLSGALLLEALCWAEHKSYMAAFAAAVLLTGAYLLLRKKFKARRFACERMGTVKTGAILTGVCFIVKLAWVLLVRLEPTVDYYTFWITAVELGRGAKLSSAEYVAMFPHILGYSRFLGFFTRLFGESSMLAPILNVVLTMISGLLIYGMCLERRGIKTAAFAYLLWILCPSVTLYNTMVLSEPFYTCLILLFLFLVLRLARRLESLGGLCAGILTGLAGGLVLAAVNAARPIAAVPLIAFFLWLLLLRGERLREKGLWLKWLSFSLVLVLTFTAAGALWDRYAENRLGEKPAEVPGYSVYVGFNPDSLGSYSNEDMALLMETRYDEGYSADEAQKIMLEAAKARISSGEVNFLRLFAGKLQTFLGNDEGGVYYSMAALSPRAYSLWAVISNVFYYGLCLLALLGAADMWKKKEASSLLMAPMFVLGLTLAQMLVEVAGRYHYSIIPMLIMIAAFFGGAESEKGAKENGC